MGRLTIHANIVEKLRNKHNVDVDEVYQCFGNVTRGFIEDTREDCSQEPKTYWFIEQTDSGRHLLVAFMPLPSGEIVIKSAYEPSDKKLQMYLKLTKT